MTSDALPADADIGRVALRVGDLEETAAFYEETIGLERLDSDVVGDTSPDPDGVAGTDGDRVVLGAADEPFLVLDHAPDASPRTPTQTGLYHVAIRVPDRATLGAAIARLRGRDLIDGAADHGVSEAIYLRDPEGNGLELYADRPRAEWPLDGDRVVMVTDPLDLEALVALAEEGAASRSLPAGSTIGHVHLEVVDLEPTRTFYADALGMRIRQRMGDQALFLAAGEYHHHVGANTWRRRSERAGDDSLGLAWFEVAVPNADALAAAADRLAAAGSAVGRPEDGLLAVTDPDGIGLRLRVDDSIAAPTGE